MKTDSIYPIIGSLALFSLLGPPQTFATTKYSKNAVSVIPDTAGLAVCQRYLVGGKQIRRSSNPPIAAGEEATLNGPLGASVTYRISADGTELEFNSNTKINEVVVKGGTNRINKYSYAGQGSLTDSKLSVLPATGNLPLAIKEFALCYGVDTPTDSPVIRTDYGPLLRCDRADAVKKIDCAQFGLGPGDVVLVRYRPLTNSSGGTAELIGPDPRTCFCAESITELKPCSPPQNPGDPDTCREDKLPVYFRSIQDNDPWYCETWFGTEYCWQY